MFTTPKEISSILRSLKNKKAPGLDKIPNIALKNITKKAKILLTKIINAILKFGIFPLCWKSASIVPVFKPGKNPNLAESYRPISLLSSISKIAEKVILNRINKFLNQNNIIQNEQFGFRKGLSTDHALIRIAEKIQTSFNEDKSTVAVLLDKEKAFDSVWHDGMIFKLIELNTPAYLIKLIKNYLNDRTFCVCINGNYSIKEKY